MNCPRCKQPLIEVDNPMRREFRHRRGTICRDVPAESLATEFLPPVEQEHDTTGRLERLSPAETMERDAREGRTRVGDPGPPPWSPPELTPAEEELLALPDPLPDPWRVIPNEEWAVLLEQAAQQLCYNVDCQARYALSGEPCRVHFLQAREHMTRRYEEQQGG